MKLLHGWLTHSRLPLHAVLGLTLASASSVGGPLRGSQGDAPVVVKEAKSKVPFQSYASFATGAKDEKAEAMPVLSLAGTGIRTKTIFKVKVYAMGLYMHAGPTRTALAKWKGKDLKSLSKDEGFYKAMMSAPVAKSMRLVMTRDVDGEDMAEAFSDSLGPRVKTACEGLEAADADKARASVKAFEAYFSVDELKEDVEILFTWLPSGQLVTSVGGEVQGVLVAPILCAALFDIYFGKDPISDSSKTSLISRIPEMLAAKEGAK